MNIYPPLLPAPGFPYLSAGKILPASQPWGRGGGCSQPPQSVSGQSWRGGGVLGSRGRGVGGRLPTGWAGAPAQETRHCQGRVRGLPVWSGCECVCVRGRGCAAAGASSCFPRAEDVFLTFHSDAPDFLPLPFFASLSSRFCPLHLPHPVPSPGP